MSEQDQENAAAMWRLEHSKISHQAAFEYAKIALNALVLANGGAVLAILTFLGGMWKENSGASGIAAKMVVPLGLFAFGLFLVIVSAMLSFAAQGIRLGEYARGERSDKVPQEKLAVISGVLSAACFVFGSFVAVRAF